MKWYRFPLDDYQKLQLADAEDLAFRRMIDLYYVREGPLPLAKQELEEAIRLDWDCIEPVLYGYFRQTETGWVNDWLQEDVERRIKRTQINISLGKKGGRPKKLDKAA